MKKLFTLSLLVLIGFTLTGCTILNKTKQDIKDTKEQLQTDMKTKIEEVFANNNPKECTYSTVKEGKGSTGIMYIDGKKIAHFMTTQNEETKATTEINYIMKDDWIYSWGKGNNIPAMKMQLSELTKIAPKPTEATKTTEDTGKLNYKEMGLQTGLDLTCKEWTVDTSKFEPPMDITFTDVTKTMKDFTEKLNQTTEKVKDLSNSKCAACNMAPDESIKKECLASLGCN